ncbi:MAG: 2-isopropylmalate synthase [Peptococcaceae bacterium]|jgi:2-isopropylmalate synthase|nr:2-isopropylmalate synthase [Peptococcaceae bacterium]
MSTHPVGRPQDKYAPYAPVALPDRTWPSRSPVKAPLWCSTDLRDGNQALPIPMSLAEKLEYFRLLTEVGLKEIEVGYPSASETEFAFVRHLIREKLIPADVTIQVVTPCIEELIEKTFQASEGAERVILHFLNSTSPVQRELVYNTSPDETVALATAAAARIRGLGEAAERKGAGLTYEYSPESFTETEPDFALRITEAVLDALGASKEKPVIINLPATVEKSLPNQYADLVEWFGRQVRERERLILSVHPHNDRGTAAAAAELALLAGAQRVEGTLFGNGERTGNADLVTLALNLYTQGIEPGLDFSDINRVRDIYQKTTHMSVGARHPYAGELVYTAFAGAHQDAILKVIDHRRKKRLNAWQVPYLPLDPGDVGRQYEPLIRINSQSGKGAAGFVLETLFGYKIPKAMLPELGHLVKEAADREKAEITGETLFALFNQEFIRVETPYELKSFRTSYLNEEDAEDNEVRFTGVINDNGQPKEAEGRGNGPIDALYDALKTLGAADYEFVSYDQHALSGGSDSRAIAYIQLRNRQGQTRFGAGTSKDIKKASLRALISAVNRMSRIQP